MRFAFIRDHQGEFPADLMCEVLGVSRSGSYAWRDRPPSPHAVRRGRLAELIREVHEEARSVYGSPRVHRELGARGVACGENTGAKLMREHGIRSEARRGFVVKATDSRHDRPVADNVLAREFDPDKPDTVWAADITSVLTAEGRLSPAAVIDLCSRKVVGWATADHLRAELPLEALRMALAHRKPAGELLHHSDRGVQYASEVYQSLLAVHGIEPSMSRKGNCWGNAVVESFFSALKRELVHHESYADPEGARGSLFEYIEVFYNRRRRPRRSATAAPPSSRPVRNNPHPAPTICGEGQVVPPRPGPLSETLTMWLTSLIPGRSFDPPRHGTRLSHRRPTPRRRSAAPRLEVMEDRTVLSTLTVVNINDSGPGSLRQAILDANSNDSTTNTINFDPALSGKTITLTSGELDITKNVNIDGTSLVSQRPWLPVTISGNNSSRVFEFAGGTNTISALNIANANSTSSSLGGGGILNEANLTVSAVNIIRNSAAFGGGIENAGGTLTVNASNVEGNTASIKGGGIDNTNAGTVTLTASNVEGNTASTEGGGIDNTNAGTVTLEASNVQGNTAPVGPDINGPFTAHASNVGGVNGPFTAHASNVGGVSYGVYSLAGPARLWPSGCG